MTPGAGKAPESRSTVGGMSVSLRVAVVGAGFAGLTTAHRLAEAGCEVVVLEARDRVGGRVWSISLDNGEIVEMGGEWIASGQHSVLGLASSLGVGLVDPGIDFVSRDAVGGEMIPVEGHRRVNRALGDLLASIPESALETTTAAEILGRMAERSPEFEGLRSRLEGQRPRDLDHVEGKDFFPLSSLGI